MEQYLTILTGGEGEVIEKRSRFIATVRPVETEEEADLFWDEMKKKYYDARHNCFAFQIKGKPPIVRSSDDGEPSGTAGKPMLEVITGMELYNIAVVVTRYFGGTLLGTGGLVRAYTNATKEGILHSQIIEKKRVSKIEVLTDYQDMGKIQYLLGNEQIHTLTIDYTEHVKLTILVPVNSVDKIKKQLIQCTNGKVGLEEKEQLYYAMLDKNIMIFDK